MREHETDWRKVVGWLTGPLPAGKRIFYQKHMPHHLLPGMAIDWIDTLTNCFLIREPGETLLSLIEFLPSPTTEETGLPQQVALFERACQHTGSTPPVIDAREMLADPRGMLRALCARVGVPFCDAMLGWPPGPRNTDGAWAKHWYAKVYDTTGFGPHRPKGGRLPDHLRPVLDECQELYQRLKRWRISTSSRSASLPNDSQFGLTADGARRGIDAIDPRPG